jgi:large subunit ribosomal protein L25
MKIITIEGNLRTEAGKPANKKLRKENLVPCNIYGEGKNVHFSAHENSFNALLHSPAFCKAKIIVDGNEFECIVKETQYHPVTDKLLHVDFLQLIPNKPVITEIPIRTVGSAPGVLDGGKLAMLVRSLKVKSTPEYIVDFVTVDISNLELNKSIKVADLIDKGINMEIITPSTIPLVAVIIPRALRSEEATDETEEGEEGEDAEQETAEAESAE